VAVRAGDLPDCLQEMKINESNLVFSMSQLQNAPFCPISASGSNFNPRNILYIPVVKIFAFLDLEQN
jgi:hypothetical protein